MYAHTNTNRDSDANSYTHCYTKAYSDTAAPSDAAASPDSAALKEIMSEESATAAARDW